MSFPRHARYKDSGLTCLGQVPMHWRIQPLKRIANIRYGIGEPPQYAVEGTPLIRATNVHAGNLLVDGVVFVDPRDIPEQRIVWLNPGDIIVVRSGAYTGDSAIIPPEFGACIAGFDMVLRCHSALPQFIQFALLSKYLKEGQIDIEKMRAAQPHLNAEELGSCLVALPDVKEQSTIVEWLTGETSKIDLLVAEQQRLVELLREKRQALVAHAVTKGLNPTARIRNSGIEWLGMVPTHWQPIRLGALFRETADAGNDALPVLSVSIHHGVSDKEFDEDELDRKVTRSEDRSKYIRVKPGDLVYNMMRAWQGAFGSVKVEGMVSPAYVVARPRTEVCTEFVEYLLRTPQAIEELRRHSHGVTDFRLRLYWDEFKSIRVAVPPLLEQRAILEFISTETRKINALIAESGIAIALLQERRTALVSAVVTGKIDVRGLVSAVPKQEAAA